MRVQLAKLSRSHEVAKAFNYILKRWVSFTVFLQDGAYAYASRTMPPKGDCEAPRLEGSPGCSAALIAQGGSPQLCTAFIAKAKMNGVDCRRGLRMFSPGSTPIRLIGRTSFCPRIACRHHRCLLERHELSRQQSPSRHRHHPGRKEPWRQRLRDVAIGNGEPFGSLALAKSASRRSPTSASNASSSSSKSIKNSRVAQTLVDRTIRSSPRPPPDAYVVSR
ncbi:hypothetical protein ABIA00_003370 [Bradyrhizobium ottawaense]